MVYSVGSFQERIIRTIEQALQELGLVKTEENDFASASMEMGTIMENPIFNVKLQLLPELNRLKAAFIRGNINVAVLRNAGKSPNEQSLKVDNAIDRISKWIRDKADTRLNGRNFRITNKDVQDTGLLTLAILQFECVAFMRKGEY